MKYWIWHNTRGIADEYFLVRNKDDYVFIQIPKFIGKPLRFIFRVMKNNHIFSRHLI